jgi:hypothetical protein
MYLTSFIGNPKLGLTHSRCAVLTVKCGIGTTAIGAAKCVAHIYYIQYFVVCVNNYVSFVYFGLNSGHENGRLR